MSLMSRRLYYLCITVLVSLAYIETATGQATEIVTTIATAWITETIDVLDLNPPVNVELKEFPSNNTAFSVTWNHTTDLNVTYDIVVTTPDGSEDEQREVNKMSGYIITDKAPGQEYNVTVVALDTSNSKDASSDSQLIRLSPNAVDNLERKYSNNTHVQAQWDKPSGEVSGYNVTCSPGVPLKAEIKDENETEAFCYGDDIAGMAINMTVVTISVGKSSVPAYVTIQANPNPVLNLMESDANTTSVTATWTAPIGEVEYYEVNCSNGSVVSSVVEDGNQYEASCTGMIAGDTIMVTVTSISNSARSSPESVPITAFPNPVVLMDSDASTDSVTVTWVTPVGTFDSYKGVCSNGSLDDLTLSSTSATCRGVTPGNVVTVTVTTVSGLKESPDDVNVTAIPNAVENLMESDATTTNVTVMWTSPGGIFDGYSVDCSNGSLDGSLTRDSTEATCVGVTAGNVVTVTVTTNSGTKINSDSENVTALPYMVLNLIEKVATMETIEASWQFPGGFVSTYSVSCSNGTANPPEVNENNSGEYSSVCEGLPTPGDNYTMTVTAVSEGTPGAADTVQITAVPSSPVLLGLPSSVENVSASWNHPKGIVDSFEVNCKPADISTPVQSTIDAGSSNSFQAACTVERPGELFSLSVTSVSGSKTSSESVEPLRASPEPVEMFEVTNYTDNGVTLSWMMKAKCENDNCVWTSFEISYNSTLKDNIPKASTSLSVDSLTPGAEYHFSISVISFDEPSTSENTIQRLKPSSVGLLEKKEVTETKAIIEWTKPDGEVTGYDTTIESMEVGRGGGETGGFDGNLGNQKHTATFENLTPGLSYEITVCTESYNERCITRATITIDTLPALPSAPLDVLLQDEDIHTVIVTFSEPEFPNGDIMEYIIRYSGVKGGSDDQEEMENSYTPEEEEVAPYSVPVDDLVAGYTYTFEVSAINDEGEGTASDPKHITLDELEPEVPVITPTKGSAGEPGVHSFKIEFNPDIFTHCNGELLTYTVLVVEDSAYDENDGTATSGKGRPDTFSYDQAQNGAEYQAFEEQTYPFKADYSQCGNTASRKKRQTDEPMIVPIGDESCSGGYCNGKLHGNRNYRVKFRAFNAVGYADSAYSEPIETKLNHVSWVIPFLFVVIILVAFGLVYLRRKERNKPGSVPLFKIFKFKDGGATNDGFVPDKPMRRTGDTRPIKLAAFGNHLEDMSRDSDYLFSEEYNDLRPVGKNQSTDAAQLEVNRVKNRFSNILPYDHTRVKLDEIDDEEGSDYINANYMLGYISNREYIACQGPLQSTEEDMWRLVWEQGASLIVMVTQLMENGKIKCHQYWPDEGEGPVRYGEIVVNPSGVEHEELWTKRNFQITKGPATRNVAHFNFLAWPDHGVPEKPDDLIRFVQAVRTCKKLDGKPAVVHCSAGVGRTGTFISLDNLMTAMKDKDEVDIFGMVRNMRMNRCLMVQTESQYIFIHQCVMALLEGGPSSSDSEAVYENVNGNGGYYQEALI